MRYELTWRNKWLTAQAGSMGEMIEGLEAAAGELRAMQARGVTLHDDACTADDNALLVTDDPAVAEEFGFVEEEWDEEEGCEGGWPAESITAPEER